MSAPDPIARDEITPVDIVVRLRSRAVAYGGRPNTASDLADGADEIDRLCAENEALRVDLAWANRRIDDMEAQP